MAPRDYLLFDTETTGTNPKKHQILSVALLALDSELKPTGFKSIKIKYDEYIVEPGALAVNKIDLVKHHNDPKTMNVSSAKVHLIAFFNTPVHRPAGVQTKMMPVGHCVNFDIGFMLEFLPTWSNFMHYRTLDTQVMAVDRILSGKMPDCGSGLGDLTKHFKIEHKNAHTAKGDVQALFKVLKKLLAI